MACLPTYNNKRYSSIQELINALSLEETARAYREAVTASGALVPRLDEFSSVHEWVDYYNEHASQGSYARIAFLGLDYVESVSTTGVVTRTTTTPIISDSAQEFLRHKKFKPGTALTAKVNDNDDTLIYDPTASDNSQITWGKLKEMLAEGNLETKSGIPLTKDDLVPIDLYLGEDKIPGNVHTLAWVDKNAKNTDKEGNDIKQHELNEIERVRQLIIGGNTDLVITNYDFGMFNTGDVKQLPTDLETVIIKNGEVMVGSVAKELITPDVVDGITYAVTDQGLVPVERDRLSEVEKDSVVNFINAVFNPQSNSTLITALASKGIDVRDMVQVERFISTFVKTERPVTPANFNTVMQEHANRLYDYRVKTGKDLPPYTGIEVNKEGTDFSLLIGRTNAGKNTYTTYKITKVKGKTEVHIFKRDDNDVYKYVNSGIDPSTFIKNTLRNLLINRKVNHTDAKAIHLIEDGAINTVDYTNYMKGRLLSNINFNKTATGKSW